MSPLATPNSAFINVDDRDVLDVRQVARLLGVGRNTIYTLVARNQIPHRRLGKAIRFSRAGVMSGWLRGHRGTRRKGTNDACMT
jgi:excisionase family DNA binding protein